jgi:hypothetical protein
MNKIQSKDKMINFKKVGEGEIVKGDEEPKLLKK